jgi:DNA-binding NarL/FixJ family response regulator
MLSTDPGLSVTCEADSAHTALRAVEAGNLDLAIVDLSLGESSGLDLIRRIGATAPGLPVLVLTMHDEALFAERALRAGARGYIMKEEAIEGLIRAVRAVLSGQIYVSEATSQVLLQRLRSESATPSGRLGNLTDRELTVFEMIGRGLSTAAIAERLDVSVKTVETHKLNIKYKLNLKDAADLIRYAATWAERI